MLLLQTPIEVYASGCALVADGLEEMSRQPESVQAITRVMKADLIRGA
jgi:hypothetical protein